MYRQTNIDQNNQGEGEIYPTAKSPHKLSQTICCDCAFRVEVADESVCIHPEELDVNCATVVFCNSFQPSQEVDSPCVTFGNDDAE
ncbi:MAG TPA: hypothetical protein V6D25_01945 [Leptolyngbyaceae cyanobacterium]